MSLPELPVVAGFHPDPSICRVGDTYYLACSSFEYAPGVPVFRSEDLVTWTAVGHALHRAEQLRLRDAAPSGGVYAPTLRHHDGRFWLVTTNVSDGGHLLVTASDPAGPWSDPVRIALVGGIDPDIAWDDAGTCYLTWSDGAIRQAVLDPGTGALLSEPVTLWSGTGGKDVEAPHLYQVSGTWYLLVAEGGTAAGHAVSVARGPSPQGPWEANPSNPVVTARGTASAVQNTGHADLVQRPDGTWAMVFLGVRPAGYFPSWHVLGRETFAAELRWEDGWPVLGEPIQPDVVPPARTVLEAPLGHDWVGAGRFPDEVLRPAAAGWTLAAPDPRTFVGRRQEHTRFTARARVEAADGVGGLEVRIDPLHALTLEVDGPVVRALARIGGIVKVLGEAASGGDLVLESVDPPHPQYSHRRGPDELVASIATPDGLVEVGRLDGRYLSTEVAGGFTGRMVGLSAERGAVSVGSFEYQGA
ncbi:glycoside hydrolase family 43 protein [Antribacter gilvus]|uniref:glycoside hydrolase family 43 protein n=1 Tax=Antribacter gilvus TaxID=2304675 RepID=UPI000F7AF648|nr:glycoside hydrolase family 43 protein [Antribacter gilvus]